MAVKPSTGKNPFLGLVIILSIFMGLGYLSFAELPKHRKKTITVWYIDSVPSPYDTNPADGIDTVIQVAYKDKLTGDKILLFEDTDLVQQLKGGHRYELQYHCVERRIGHYNPWILDSYKELDSG